MMTTARELQPCGTFGAYQRHGKRGETPCDACRKASREYTQAYRERTGHAYDRAYSLARARVLTRLATLHPEQYRILMAEEMDQ